MPARGGETLRADALQRWTRVLDLRVAMIAAGAVLVLLMPTVPGSRTSTGGFELGIVIPYSLVLCWRIRRTHRLDAWVPVTDMLMIAGFAAIVPDAWPGFVATAVAIVALAVVVHGRVAALAATAVGTLALSLAALRVPTGGPVGVSTFFIISLLVTVTIGYARASEADLHDRYTALVNGLDGIVWEWDVAAQRFTVMSDQVERILGWPVEDALEVETWMQGVRGGAGPRELIRAALADGVETTEVRARHGDGHTVWLRSRTTEGRAPDGTVSVVRGILTDTTAEHDAALALRQYADIVAEMPLGVAVWRLVDPDDDASLTLVSMNPAVEPMLDLAADRAVGRRLVELFPDGRALPISRIMADVVRSGAPRSVPEVPYDRPDGRKGFYSATFVPLPGGCVAALTDDVSERHHAAEALRHQALHDPLTGLPNRALLKDRLSAALATASRTGDSLALLVMDLDQFKEVNDTLGHPMGDQLLAQVGSRLATALRDCDTVARLGGDEFAVLLTTDASRAGARQVAERIRAELGRPYDLGGVTVQSAASIGIVLCPEHGDDAGMLTQRADIAMYNAKRSGQGFAFYVAEDDKSSLRRLALAGDLHRAVERDELVLHYQPQVDLVTDEVIGVEALVRWRHPVHGLLPPAEFISLAEVSGAIMPLTRWVLRQAIEDTDRLRQAGHTLVVGVNVSGRNLYDPDLPATIAADLARFGLPGRQLLVELTESELVEDPSQVMTVLTLVAEMGVRVAVDDFGTGWSSLSNLTRLPVQQVKIDRAFVTRMLESENDAVIVRSIIDLGHNLGMVVMAEGVETDAVRRTLASLGCDHAQGYLLARPMPYDQLVSWLATRKLAVTSA